MTHKYIGTKVITAWEQDKVIQPTSESYVTIERGYAVKYPDGYVSWSPKGVFEEAYRVAEGETQSLTFGDALYFLKEGMCAQRIGWNGAGQYVFLVKADEWTFTNGKNDNMPLRSFLALRTTDGKVVPWQPSSSDTLAEDWSAL
jgi:hypothetical protein